MQGDYNCRSLPARIGQLEWMGDDSANQALAKLEAFKRRSLPGAGRDTSGHMIARQIFENARRRHVRDQREGPDRKAG